MYQYLGADHHGYIPRMKAAMGFLGFDSNNLEIILAQMVSLLKDGEPYKMSKRAGNFILMSDVVDEIGSDALRYIFLSKKCDTHLGLILVICKKKIALILCIISTMHTLEFIKYLLKLVKKSMM